MHEELNENFKVLTVSRSTAVHDLAVSISKNIEEGLKVQLIGIGANAVNQMTKGAGKARQFLAPIGKDVAWKIYFTDREIGEGELKERVSALVFESLLY